MWFIGVFVFLFLVTQSRFSVGEVFTAIVDMEVLLRAEKALTFHLQSIVKEEEERLKELKRYLEEYELVDRDVGSDGSKYLANPINAYILVKRLTTDLKSFEATMFKNSFPSFMTNLTRIRNDLKFPSAEDLNGAAVALTRLQDTYKLEATEVAEGVLWGKKYFRRLSAGDCFELGRQLYNNQDFAHAEPWFREALEKVGTEEAPTASRLEVLEYLEFTTFKLGNLREALSLANQVLQIKPNHERIKVNRDNYERYIREDEENKEGEAERVQKGEEPAPFDDNYVVDEHYKALCRGEKLLDPEIERQLMCRYVHRNIPFLRLQPVKEEEANLNPRIVVYHDVIHESEIATVKRMAVPRLQRATVVDVRSGHSFPAPYRIAKSGFINDFEHPHIKKISRRIEMITGLDMGVAESLQVVNYGIGGQYEPHNDHSSSDVPNAYSPIGQDWGNRMATWLFYMSDVEVGGATVFPRINVALWPRKGSAALWYNLLPNGEGDDRTYHASCPVFIGSKWVCNKWIHERTQLFRRPCKLDQDAQH